VGHVVMISLLLANDIAVQQNADSD
jgi:hypothetical protein